MRADLDAPDAVILVEIFGGVVACLSCVADWSRQACYAVVAAADVAEAEAVGPTPEQQAER